MQEANLRLIGIVGGVILVLGVLLVASQQFVGLTGGASADVINYDLLPPNITVSSEEYRQAYDLIGAYQAKTDLASKNEIIQELSELMASWPDY